MNQDQSCRRRRIVGRLAACWVVYVSAILAENASAQSASKPDAVSRRAIRPGSEPELDWRLVRRLAWRRVRSGLDWYQQTPPADRVCWGGLIACSGLGLGVFLERIVRLRRRRIIPANFTARFLDRLYEGKLDGGKALDYCEMNPSPAARIALAAVRRWGRPAVDLERAVALAHKVESELLRRNVGTLRRIAALAPLLGLLATLAGISRVLAMLPGGDFRAEGTGAAVAALPWGPALAESLFPLTTGIALATLALVAYDALFSRIEQLSGALDRLGAETIDAIAMTTSPRPPALLTNSLHPHERPLVSNGGVSTAPSSVHLVRGSG
jgi:biopolymer transport protein ExbB